MPSETLLPLSIHRALQHLVPSQRPRLMLVPAKGETQQTIEATQHLKSLKGGGFPVARLLKESSVLVTAGRARLK